MLPNGNFALNTLGQTEYIDNDNQYHDCVDGWEFGYGDCTLSVLSNGVKLTKAEGITNPTNFRAKSLPIRLFPKAGTYIVTFAVDNVSSVQQIFNGYDKTDGSSVYFSGDTVRDEINNIVTKTVTVTEEQYADLNSGNVQSLNIGIQKYTDAESLTIYWAKLEEGTLSTAPNALVQNSTQALYAKKASSAESAETATNSYSAIAELNNTRDLNTLQGSEYWGKRYYGGGTGVANRPEGVNGYSIEIIRGDATTTVQRLYSVGASESSSNRPTAYQRFYNGTTWSAWEEITTADGSYPDLTAGKAVRLSQSVKFSSSNQTGGTVGWWEIATVSGDKLAQITGISSYSAILLINGLNPINETFGGIIEVDCRVDSGTISPLAINLSPKILCGGLSENDICAVLNAETNELHVYLLANGSFEAYSITVVDESYIHVLQPSEMVIALAATFYSTSVPDGAIYAVNVNRAAYDAAGANIPGTYVKFSSTSALHFNIFVIVPTIGGQYNIQDLTVTNLSVNDYIVSRVKFGNAGDYYICLLKVLTVNSATSAVCKVIAVGREEDSFDKKGTYPDLTAGDSQKINNLEILRDENAILKIGDTVIPQKMNILKQTIYCLDATNTVIQNSETSSYFTEMFESEGTYEIHWARLDDSNQPIETFRQIASIDKSDSNGLINLLFYNVSIVGQGFGTGLAETQLQRCRILYDAEQSHQVQVSPILYSTTKEPDSQLSYYKSAILKIYKIID